ncbi:MAG: DUF805 domain-containing protein [Pseudomonadota bacterium]
MDFVTAVKTCLTQKYARFTGRASRPEYWWFFLALFIGAVVFSFLGPLSIIYSLAVLCPALAVGFRRLQDTGKPGWYIVIPFGLSVVAGLFAPDVPSEADIAAGAIPDIGGIGLFAVLGFVQLIVALVFLWWLTRPSDPETNAYGPPPRKTS